ncbi:hypothetical protein MOSE0_F01530 [Monosporozyma servazzii]
MSAGIGNSSISSGNVDEMVDSLVQEIDNELMIHTLEDVDEGDQHGKDQRQYQLPLQDIGEETLDMIVNYNTRVNSDLPHGANDDDSQSDGNSSVLISRMLPELEDADMDISDVEFSPLKRLGDPNIERQVDEIASSIEQIQDKSLDSNTSLQDNKYGEEELHGMINLPPLPERTPMFRNSSLAQLVDNSFEKDVTPKPEIYENITPKDFLSVWHMQDTISSPAISHNSQFTKYTNSTMTSSPPSTSSPRNSAIFKFKPRVVSQSKIYYPRSNVSSRVTSGIYSMITTDSIKQELEDNHSNTNNNHHQIFVPYHEYELANTINLQEVNRTAKDLIYANLNDDADANDDKESKFEDDLGFSFDDLFNKLDSLGNDTLGSEYSMLSNKPVEPTLPQLTREVTPEAAPAQVEARHVSSPFKIKQPNKVEIKEEIIERQPSIVSIQDEEEIIERQPIQDEEEMIDANEMLKDCGVFYINVLNLQGFKIEGYKHRNAKFCLEFKQGSKLIHTTPYKPVSDGPGVSVNKEFSFIVNDEFKSFGNNKLTVNLKVQYDKILKQPIEVVKKVAVKRRFPFSKTRYVYEKTFVDKPVEMDPWSNIIDPHGRFGICEVDMSDSMLQDVEFSNGKRSLKLVNTFSKGVSKPFDVGTLNVEMLYVPRKNNDECIPLQLHKVTKIVAKHLYQMNLHHEGYLLQEGGDVMEGTLQRRYFCLDGTTLMACHEMTQTPLISINLLNVSRISSSLQAGERIFTDFTDVVLFGDHIKLQFFDGETITLTADTADGDSLDRWNRVLQEVVSLNVSHQPWVESMQ